MTHLHHAYLAGQADFRIIRRYLLLLIVLALGLFSAWAANAQCVAHQEAAAALEAQHGELPVFQGISDRGYVIIVFASQAGSFTVAAVGPDGCGRQLDAGEAATVQPIRAPSNPS